MLFSEYLHEKAEESHKETVGYFMIVIDSIFFVGGLLETVIKVEKLEWFLIIPYNLAEHTAYSLLGLTLVSIGFVNLFRNNLKHLLCKRKRMVHTATSQGTCYRGAKTKNQKKRWSLIEAKKNHEK